MDKHEATVVAYLRKGDTITHSLCMGVFQEHIFTKFDGKWIHGVPTADTRRLEGWGRGDGRASDIAPKHVTHINRVPVSVVEHEVSFEPRKGHAARVIAKRLAS